MLNGYQSRSKVYRAVEISRFCSVYGTAERTKGNENCNLGSK